MGRPLCECLAQEPEIAVVDIRLPRINGLETLHLLKTKLPKIKVLILTGVIQDEMRDLAIRGEADGFLVKVSRMEKLETAVDTLCSGGQYFLPELLQHRIRHRS